MAGAATLLLAGGLPAVSQTSGQSNDSAPSQTQPKQSSPQPAAQPSTPAKPANDNAFPEETSRAAEKEAEAADKSASNGPAAGADADTSSSSRTRMKGLDLLGDNDSRASNGAGGTVLDPKLAKEDIRVGQLYMGSGNFPGAYSRFKEATLVGPGNPDAVFYLAEAARKTAHLDEAAQNYKLYLDADPKGKKAKEAKKALADLAGK